MPQKQQKGQDKHTDRSIRRVRYQVAMSLDGFIAGPNGEADWIIMDLGIDFEEIYSQFDTMLTQKPESCPSSTQSSTGRGRSAAGDLSLCSLSRRHSREMLV
jgi:hypothetical protein